MLQKTIMDIYAGHKEMLALLRELVLIQSGSYNKKGLDRMARTMAGVLEETGLETRVISFEHCGDMVLARTSRAGHEPGLLLVGHMDTVFPADTSFDFYREDGDRVLGPGVLDMKGGLVVGVFALKALARAGILDDLPVTVFCNSEEEIGSLYSRKIIESLCRENRLAFVLEGGGLNSEVVVGRKGKIGLELDVQGRGGHAGNLSAEGKSSAILEAAHKIIQLEALNHPPDILVNVGLVRGGMGANCIPETALLEVDIRYKDPADEARIMDKVREICGYMTVPGTNAGFRQVSGRPPMPASLETERLYSLVEEAAQELELPLARETRGGVSDANFIAAAGLPVLDGLGPLGDCDHSEQEYILKESLPQRCALLALSMLKAFPGLKSQSV